MAEARGNGHGSHPQAVGSDRGMIWIEMAPGIYELRDPRSGLPVRYAVQSQEDSQKEPTNGDSSVQ